MTQIHFTLTQEEVQSLIEKSVSEDLSRKILTKVFNELMEMQRDTYIGVGEYERREGRTSQRNGYYEREFTTRIGTLTLRVPRTRDGKFSPDIFEPYQRNEKALLACIVEMYVKGVSTRKVSEIVEVMCGKSVSKSFVSSLTKDLDEIVQAWQNRPLDDKEYPYIMVDVLYIKVREHGRVISKSCHIAVGIDKEGYREIIGFMIQEGESEETWSKFFNYLLNRGLRGVKLIISDAHMGLIKSIKKSFTGASWQRCQVHFLRNILSSIPKKESGDFKERVKLIFRLESIEAARKAKNDLISEYGNLPKYAKACEKLEDGFEDAFQYATLEPTSKRLRSTNILERLNGEVRRREKVVRIFPNVQSANRLIGAILMDRHEDWISQGRKYMVL